MRLGLGIAIHKRQPANKPAQQAGAYAAAVVSEGGEVVGQNCLYLFLSSFNQQTT